jgi:hypothetical protein
MFVAGSAMGQTAGTSTPTARQVADRTLPSVVFLSFDTGLSDKEIIASGFFVTPEIIATNYRVVDGTRTGYVKVPGSDDKVEIAGIVAADSGRGLVLLKVKGVKGKPLPLGDSRSASVGDQVYAVGNPEGLEGTFSKGVISSIRRDGRESLLQITAPVSVGSGGGPVLNLNGDVIAVVLGGLPEGENLNFAIPVAFLKTLVANPRPLQPLARVNAVKGEPELKTSGAFHQDNTARETDRTNRPAGTPGLTSADIADARNPSRFPRKGARTEVHIFTESKSRTSGKDFHFNGEQCTFGIESSNWQDYDRNGDGLLDYMPLGIECEGASFGITLSTDRIYQNLSPGSYEKARPPRNANYSLPGFELHGEISCDAYDDASFEILDLQVDISNKGRPRLVSLGVEFKVACRVSGPVRGNIYYNYAP